MERAEPGAAVVTGAFGREKEAAGRLRPAPETLPELFE